MSEKISVLIIAHNEEAHVDECLRSIRDQSQIADEIILIVHNSNDRTEKIGKSYPEVLVYPLETEEEWPLYARKYGFEKVTGDIVLCIDGDTYAEKFWIENLIKPFEKSHVHAVAWYPILLANRNISRIWFLQWHPLLRPFFHFYFWWANFACRKKSYDKVGWMDRCRSIALALGLNYSTEDMILSFLLLSLWDISFSKKAVTYTYPWKFFVQEGRNKKQYQDYKKILKYFREKKNH